MGAYLTLILFLYLPIIGPLTHYTITVKEKATTITEKIQPKTKSFRRFLRHSATVNRGMSMGKGKRQYNEILFELVLV
jgi:hypothetical protein